MTDSVPDASMPEVPSLRDAFKVFAPSGTNTGALLESLKASRMPVIGQQGTTCAGCGAHGVVTSHSPAGYEHASWEARWAQDPSWRPVGPGIHPSHLRDLSDAMRATENMRWCRRCSRPEPEGTGCPADAVSARQIVWAGQELPVPDDPFEPGQESGVAARILYDDMLAAGIPLSSVEAILGYMLADLVRQAPGEGDG